MWFRGVILKKATAGVVFLVRSIGTPPCPRKKRMLRSIFLIARPPLLAVMRGGEFALLKMAPNLDSCDPRRGARNPRHPFRVRLSAQTNPGVRRNRVPLANLLTPLRGASIRALFPQR